MKIKIALIDSGISKSLSKKNKGRIVDAYRMPSIKSSKDNIGHGTSIAHILLTNSPQSTIIYSMKLFDEGGHPTENDLIEALLFIDNHLDVDIVHISNGINMVVHLKKLERICNKLYLKGIFIVSAFDNQGVVSYPAALPNVIGVYWDTYRSNVNDFIYVENSPINILGYAGNHFLPWINDEKKVVSGSSFTAPYITSFIAKYLNVETSKHTSVWDYLKEEATEIISYTDKSVETNELISQKIKNIKKAILFPISKEMHSLLANIDLLNFEIRDVFDHPLSRNVGRDVDDFIYGFSVLEKQVKSISKINWDDDFDTIILGHTNTLNKMLNHSYIDFFINEAKKHKKNLYSFDNIIQREDVDINCIDNFVFSPYPCKSDVNMNTFGSLYKMPNPVLAIVGTSPHQGKFNLQLSLRRELLNKGYKVGQLGTEPSSHLFGMEVAFPNGYDSYINLSLNEQIFHVNKILSNLREKEIILIGTQSQTVPYSFGNLGFYPIAPIPVLLASEPDAAVLCVNPEDEFEYIARTIGYLENYMQTTVIALSVYPLRYNMEWNISPNNYEQLDMDTLNEIKKNMHQYFDLPIYINGKDNNNLVESCIDFFSLQ
ncbi:DUF1611 domain-containing protein [Virgibacillus sp. Bac330]|uniref:DUF1611 domain-containing protein n=1 Tax=Virgibacillus sp. Bac330 TaxID=2419841 RepID=UPI000EF447B9|nr:DUF1611 domain-containing protein [Virgibacillus sp. Bac330]